MDEVLPKTNWSKHRPERVSRHDGGWMPTTDVEGTPYGPERHDLIASSWRITSLDYSTLTDTSIYLIWT